MFTIVYVVVGLGFVATAVSIVAQWFLSEQHELRAKAKQKATQLTMDAAHKIHKTNILNSKVSSQMTRIAGEVSVNPLQAGAQLAKLTAKASAVNVDEAFKEVVKDCVVIATYTLVMSAFYSVYSAEDKSFLDALYMSVMTLTTVGFGDITPTTQGGKGGA